MGRACVLCDGVAVREQLSGLILSIYHVCPGAQIQAARLDGDSLSWLSPLIGPSEALLGVENGKIPDFGSMYVSPAPLSHLQLLVLTSVISMVAMVVTFHL